MCRSSRERACIVSMRCIRKIIIQIFWEAFNRKTNRRDDFRWFLVYTIPPPLSRLCKCGLFLWVSAKHRDHSIYIDGVSIGLTCCACWHDVLIQIAIHKLLPIISVLMTYGFWNDRNKFVAHSVVPFHFWCMNSAIRQIEIPRTRDENYKTLNLNQNPTTQNQAE